MDSLDVSALFVTKSQVSDFMARLSKVVEKIYTTDFNLEKVITEHFGMQQKDLLLKLFRENNISETTPTEIQNFLKKLQDRITAIPVVSLTIPFEPNDETLKSFSDWFMFTLKKQVLFSVTIDKSLLAGAKITYNGKYKDYSFAPKFVSIMDAMITPQKTDKPKETVPQPAPPSTSPSHQALTNTQPA